MLRAPLFERMDEARPTRRGFIHISSGGPQFSDRFTAARDRRRNDRRKQGGYECEDAERCGKREPWPRIAGREQQHHRQHRTDHDSYEGEHPSLGEQKADDDDAASRSQGAPVLFDTATGWVTRLQARAPRQAGSDMN